MYKIGIIEHNIKNKKKKGIANMKIKDCMCNNVTYLAPENTIKDCAKIMQEKHIGCVPICDSKKKIVGLVTDRDLILRCIACDKDSKNTMLSEIMTCNVCYCNCEDDICIAQDLMATNQIRRLPVVNNNHEIIGIITLGNLSTNKGINNEDVSNTLENICKTNTKNAE